MSHLLLEADGYQEKDIRQTAITRITVLLISRSYQKIFSISVITIQGKTSPSNPDVCSLFPLDKPPLGDHEQHIVSRSLMSLLFKLQVGRSEDLPGLFVVYGAPPPAPPPSASHENTPNLSCSSLTPEIINTIQ